MASETQLPLLSSPFGFGTYRVRQGDPVHRAALKAALAGGIDLIDTSVTYTDGSSEQLIGEVTQGRDDLTVVTKIGYVQGQIDYRTGWSTCG